MIGVGIDGTETTKAYSSGIYAGSGTCIIGQDFVGVIQDVALWDTDLYTTDIDSLYNLDFLRDEQKYEVPKISPLSFAGLQGWWRLNGANVLYDELEESPLTLLSGTAIYDSGYYFNMPYFDGNLYYSTDHKNGFNASPSLTVAALIRVDNSGTTRCILAKENAVDFEYSLRLHASNLVQWILPTNSLTSAAINMNEWVLVIAWYDAVAEEMGFWVNGVESTKTNADGIPATTAEFLIGSRRTTGNQEYIGNIADVAVWNRALTSSEREKLFHYFNKPEIDPLPISLWQLDPTSNYTDCPLVLSHYSLCSHLTNY
jgi:hypothetical protein